MPKTVVNFVTVAVTVTTEVLWRVSVWTRAEVRLGCTHAVAVAVVNLVTVT